MARKKTLIELDLILNDLVTKVTADFDVDEILLFGSYAKGSMNENSDIDVAVVSPDLKFENPLCDNSFELIKKSKLYQPDLQVLGFNSKKYFEELFIDKNFVREIKDTGKKIYSKEDGFIELELQSDYL